MEMKHASLDMDLSDTEKSRKKWLLNRTACDTLNC